MFTISKVAPTGVPRAGRKDEAKSYHSHMENHIFMCVCERERKKTVGGVRHMDCLPPSLCRPSGQLRVGPKPEGLAGLQCWRCGLAWEEAGARRRNGEVTANHSSRCGLAWYEHSVEHLACIPQKQKWEKRNGNMTIKVPRWSGPAQFLTKWDFHFVLQEEKISALIIFLT